METRFTQMFAEEEFDLISAVKFFKMKWPLSVWLGQVCNAQDDMIHVLALARFDRAGDIQSINGELRNSSDGPRTS